MTTARAGQEPRRRLPAPERRADLLACASRAFSQGSYRGTTTAEIARAAGVTEPILYRHFESKRDLYIACLRESWNGVRELWEQSVAAEADPGGWLAAMGRAFRESEDRVVVHCLWVQAIAEASEDPEIRAYMLEHMRGVHAHVAGVVGRAQALGAIPPDRNARAEAWVFLAIGFFNAVGGWLGGGLLDADLPEIAASRRRWLTGRD